MRGIIAWLGVLVAYKPWLLIPLGYTLETPCTTNCQAHIESSRSFLKITISDKKVTGRKTAQVICFDDLKLFNSDTKFQDLNLTHSSPPKTLDHYMPTLFERT